MFYGSSWGSGVCGPVLMLGRTASGGDKRLLSPVLQQPCPWLLELQLGPPSSLSWGGCIRMCGLRSSSVSGRPPSISGSHGVSYLHTLTQQNCIFVCVPPSIVSFWCCVLFECALLQKQQLATQRVCLLHPRLLLPPPFFSLFFPISLLSYLQSGLYPLSAPAIISTRQ